MYLGKRLLLITKNQGSLVSVFSAFLCMKRSSVYVCANLG